MPLLSPSLVVPPPLLTSSVLASPLQATACSVLPLLVLTWSICLAFYDWLAGLTATFEP